MIRVSPKPEYARFDADVRIPGSRFLEENPNPSSREFQKRNYWKRAKRELHGAYRRCAYTSLKLNLDASSRDEASVDHFYPKSKFPQLAYEWSNYRLCRKTLNEFKADSEDVVDPFHVQDNWFVVDFPSCLIRPGENLDTGDLESVCKTIDVLKLNDPDLVAERLDWMIDLTERKVSISHLKEEYRFLALQVEGQCIEGRLKAIFE